VSRGASPCPGFRSAGEDPIHVPQGMGRAMGTTHRRCAAAEVPYYGARESAGVGNSWRKTWTEWGNKLTMQSGFNTNYRHRGVLFHVQTEDSGRTNPHVITHLFYGGNIISSVKRSYSDHLKTQNVQGMVRDLMESQHKAMLKKLSRGEHDVVIGERLGPDIFTQEASAAAPEPATPAPDPIQQPVTQPEVHVELERPPAPLEAADSSQADSPPTFGERVVSQKPLDEVVLDYLVENARKRKRTAK
jgi:hypothetical protein